MNDRFESLMYHAGMTAQGCWDEMDSYQREAVERFQSSLIRSFILQLRESYRQVLLTNLSYAVYL